MTEPPHSAQCAAFRKALHSRGTLAAMSLLNDRSSFRYTATYRHDGDAMRIVQLFDRLGNRRATLRASPLERTFCKYVCAMAGL